MRARALAFLLTLSVPSIAAADIPLSPDQLGDCRGSVDVVCRRSVRGAEVLGICRRSRDGVAFCADDPDSTKEAMNRESARARRARAEALWGVSMGTAIVLAVTVLILVLRRKRRSPEPSPDSRAPGEPPPPSGGTIPSSSVARRDTMAVR